MLNRRDLITKSLLGVGALSLAPWGYINAADHSAGGQIPKRFIFIRKSNGMFTNWLTPLSFTEAFKAKEEKLEEYEEPLAKHELQEWMKGLDAYKDRLTILQGLSSTMSENGHFSYQSVMGAYRSNRGSIAALKRATVDFELAKLFPSPFGHIEYSFAATRSGIVPGFSAPAAYQKNSCYADAITAYKDLFKCVTNPSLLNSDSKMLEHLSENEADIPMRLNEMDANGIKNHVGALELIYARNKRLEKMASQIAKHMPDPERIKELGASGATMPDRQEAMVDILIASLVTGLTNVVEFTADDLNTKYNGMPGFERNTLGLHNVGHNCEGSKEFRHQVDMLHVSHIKRIVEALKAHPEGNGNMFDNTMIMYFAEGGHKHHSGGQQLPMIALTGKNINLNIAGKYIRLPYLERQGHKTLGNWYTTLLNAHGNPIEHYGDLAPELARKKVPQKGPIKEFMKA